MAAAPVRLQPTLPTWVEVEATRAAADELVIAGRHLFARYEQRVVGLLADDDAGAIGHHVVDLRIGDTVITRPLWDPVTGLVPDGPPLGQPVAWLSDIDPGASATTVAWLSDTIAGGSSTVVAWLADA